MLSRRCRLLEGKSKYTVADAAGSEERQGCTDINIFLHYMEK
jgi:hypothetical protein